MGSNFPGYFVTPTFRARLTRASSPDPTNDLPNCRQPMSWLYTLWSTPMPHKPGLPAVLLLIGLLLFQGLAPDLQAQGPPPPTPQQLDQLLAPIALYPDSLLAQITTASTNPQEILDFDNWLGQNQNLSV